MSPEVSPVIVTSRAALDESVAAAVERTLKRLNASPVERQSEGVGWLTNRGAQAALGVSKPTLARWRKAGTLAYSKVGGSVYYAVSDVEALLESRRVRHAE